MDDSRPGGSGHGAPGGRTERDEVSLRGVAIFAVGLAITTVTLAVLLVFLFRYFHAREAAGDPPPSPFVTTDGPRLPPQPRLQVTPAQDLQRLREAEAEALSGYGWIDREAGTVRIPIDRAMDLIVERGRPAREAEDERTPGGRRPAASGEASGGRAIRR